MRLLIADVAKKTARQVNLTGRSHLILAATYVPTQLPVQYHRLCGA